MFRCNAVWWSNFILEIKVEFLHDDIWFGFSITMTLTVSVMAMEKPSAAC